MSIGAIDTSRIEAMVAQLRAAGAQAAPPGDGPGRLAGLAPAADRADFASVLKSSLDQVNQMQQASSQNAQRFAMGDPSISLSDAMISLQKSSIALQQTVQVRNRLVEAYQSIMNMGI